MSSFVMHEQSHAAIANTLEYILDSGFERFGFDAPQSLHKALSDCRDRYGYYEAEKIYSRLYSLNSAAYAGRYRLNPSEITEIPDMPSVPSIVKPRQYENYHETLLPWHYRFCKLLDCLIYQCSEDATLSDPLFLALVDFSRVYKSFLVVNTDAYHDAPWGSI